MTKNYTVEINGTATVGTLIDVEADSEGEAKDLARKILDKDIEDAMFAMVFVETFIEVSEVTV